MMPLSFMEQLEREVDISFTLAQGNGGQNVNKVSTAVQLRFDVANSQLINEHCRQTLLNSGDSRLTKDGVLVLRAQEFRTQQKNKAAALERLRDLIQAASEVRKKRRATRPTRGSKERRLKSKTVRGAIKQGRGKVDF
ncbi:alternative ribosome rescue aminoacyl-tRNA hydrolase ArfB [Simiduia aestuariiviva]|uniref:Ribosome-associated protein n=1 Tax=Simiduia aestuariiviva TaxID=1510459 RepID=A0A839UIC5_9GAMM|nr:alternative ribosome rescue aminoacyl-tRNA hydrolase ArfB [Simiduia aestuariiviva]MBB3167602.1 ribosome-associated protein [Simiduia aestuariiviva]